MLAATLPRILADTGARVRAVLHHQTAGPGHRARAKPSSWLRRGGGRRAPDQEPEAALERLQGGERFDLVFSDVLMPGGMSGLDLAREVGRRWPDLPMLLATGHPADIDQGGVPVLRKPYATPELTRAVAALLRRSGREADA